MSLRETIEACLWIGFVMALVMSGPVIGIIAFLHVVTGYSVVKCAALLGLNVAALGVLLIADSRRSS